MFVTIGLTAIGCATKYFAGPIYWVALAGVFLVASTNIILMAACLTVPAEWFPPDLQIRSTTIGGISNFAGNGFGLVMSVYTSIPTNNLILAWISSLCFVAFLLTGRVSPQKQELSTTLEETTAILKQDCNLVAVITLSSAIIGVIYTYIGLLAAILEPQGLTTQEIGLAGGLFVVAGVIGSFVSNWVAETWSIVLSFRVFIVPSIVCCTGLVYSTGSTVAFTSLNILTGFSIHGLMVMTLSAISFNSYPADESIVSSIVFVLANIVSLACNFIVEVLSELTGMSYLSSLALINAVTSVPLLMIYKQRRNEYRPIFGKPA